MAVEANELRFIDQFKIKFLLPFTSCRKVTGKMSAILSIELPSTKSLNHLAELGKNLTMLNF